MTSGDKFFISVLQHRDAETLAKTVKRWLSAEELGQYKFITNYFKEYGELPGLKAFTDKYSHDASGVDAKPGYYLEQMRERHIFASLAEGVPPLMAALKKDPMGTYQKFREVIEEVDADYYTSKDKYYSEGAATRYKEYLTWKETKGVTYLSMGHDLLDSLFYGYRKADLITIGGRAGVKKTWLIILLALLMEEVVPGDMGDIMFISNEMPTDEIEGRFDCVRFQLGYEAFLKGELTPSEERRYERGLETLSKKRSKFLFLENCSTIDELSAKIHLYEPAICFIDGSYLMEPSIPEGWEKITFITRNLKQIAKNTYTPIINTTQLKRATGKSAKKLHTDEQDEFAYSNSYVQDSDIAFRMFQDSDMVYDETVGVSVAKGRRVKAGTTFHFVAPLNSMDLQIELPASTHKEPEVEW